MMCFVETNKRFIFLTVVVILTIIAAACNIEREASLLSSPTTDVAQMLNYIQMKDGSIVFDGQQINLVISEWESFPYEEWMYVEVNQQDATGKEPGKHQIPVTLGNVVLHFSDLPDEITQIMVSVKAVRDKNDHTFSERGRFDVKDDSVSIPLKYEELISYFGITHYSIWFQALGGKNGKGKACGTIAISGIMPGGQSVNLNKQACFGTNPVPTSGPAPSEILLWITQNTTTGAIGGRSGANTFCNNDPNKPAGYASVKAVISVNASDLAKNVLPAQYRAGIPVYRRDGSTKIDNDWNGLWDGTILNSPSDTKNSIWTGTNGDGTLNSTTCNEWMTDSNAENGQRGLSNFATGDWLGSSPSTCDYATFHLYCTSY